MKICSRIDEQEELDFAYLQWLKKQEFQQYLVQKDRFERLGYILDELEDNQ